MIPLLAAVLAVVLVVALWRLLDPKNSSGERSTPTRAARPLPKPTRRTQVPPDDNPDFLRGISDKMNDKPAHGPTPKGPTPGKPDDGDPSPAV